MEGERGIRYMCGWVVMGGWMDGWSSWYGLEGLIMQL